MQLAKFPLRPGAQAKTQSRLQAIATHATAHLRQFRLERTIGAALEHGGVLPEELITPLLDAWGQPDPSLSTKYLHTAMREVMRSPGPILQCGSSVETFILGIVCKHAGKQMWTIEHNSNWANVARSWLTQYEINSVKVVVAPAGLYGSYVWYTLDPNKLPSAISLALCDGSAALPSGAVGTLKRVAERLDNRAVVLGKNIKRPRDLNYLSQWAKSRGAPFVMQGKEEPFVKIALPDQTPSADYREARLNTAFAGKQAKKTHRRIGVN